jgi:hypothetical protein
VFRPRGGVVPMQPACRRVRRQKARSWRLSMTDKIIRFSLLLYSAVFLLDFFLPAPYLTEISHFLLLLILFFSLPAIRKVNRNVCLAFFLLGLLAFAQTTVSLEKMFAALGQNGGLVALYTFVPLMSMPFFYENYQEELSGIAKRYTTSVLPFLVFIQLSAYFLALVIYMGCFIILYSLFAQKAKDYNCQTLFRAALLQGYAAAGFWGPSWASPSIVASRLHITWMDMAATGFIFSLLPLLTTAFFLWRAAAKNPLRYPKFSRDESVNIDWGKVRTMCFLAAGLVCIILAVNYLTNWSMYIIVPIISLPYALGTGIIQGKTRQFKNSALDYYKNRILAGKAEYCLFIVAGFLGVALESTGVGAAVPEILPDAVLSLPELAAFLLIALIVLTAVAGVHPVVLVPSIAMAIIPESIGLNVISFAMVLLAGWTLGINISPFSAGTMIVAGLEQKNPWEVGPYTNYKFVAAMVVIFAVAAGGLQRLTS